MRLQYLSSTAAPCSTEKFRDTAVPPNPQSDCAMTPKYTNRRRGWRSKMNLTTLSTPVGYPEAMSISKVSVVNRINGRGSRRPRGWKQSSPTKYKVRRNFVNFEDFCAARVVPDYSSSFDGVHKPLQVGASRRAIGFIWQAVQRRLYGLGAATDAAHQGTVAAPRCGSGTMHHIGPRTAPNGRS